MDTIAGFIVQALQASGDEAKLAAIARDVRELCARFPLYRSRLG